MTCLWKHPLELTVINLCLRRSLWQPKHLPVIPLVAPPLLKLLVELLLLLSLFVRFRLVDQLSSQLDIRLGARDE